jgi:hypothetical protein
VAAGGRIGHRSCGPIPYWYVVFDAPELPDEPLGGGVQLAGFEDPDTLLHLALGFAVNAEPRQADFLFRESVEDVVQLALIALASFVRIDVFSATRDGRLELVDRGLRQAVGAAHVGYRGSGGCVTDVVADIKLVRP